jgi:DNA-binding transcriptional LysR family regulator
VRSGFVSTTRHCRRAVDAAELELLPGELQKGLGLAYMPEDLVLANVKSGRLIRVLDDWCPPFSGYHLYYPSRRHISLAFAVLVEALRLNRELRP